MAVRGRLRRASFALVLALSLPACAIFEGENRRTLNALDEHLAPQSTAARWALSPLALLLGFGALAGDLLLVHPVCSVDDAWGDTVEWLWTPRGETRFRRTVMLPLVTVATPLVFAGDLAGRSVFPIEPRKDGSR
jgi:hypothetical protein